MLQRIFRPKMEEVTGQQRKMYNKELHNMYFSSNAVRVIKLRTLSSCMVKTISVTFKRLIIYTIIKISAAEIRRQPK
jgi:hypothetical protein